MWLACDCLPSMVRALFPQGNETNGSNGGLGNGRGLHTCLTLSLLIAFGLKNCVPNMQIMTKF